MKKDSAIHRWEQLQKEKFKIIKNELGLFELHIEDEFGENITLIKKTKKEIINFLKETNTDNLTFAQTRSLKDYDLVIEQQIKGEKGTISIGYKRFLELTEGSGFWKKGTALQELKDNGKVWTNYSIFTLDNNQRKYIK